MAQPSKLEYFEYLMNRFESYGFTPGKKLLNGRVFFFLFLIWFRVFGSDMYVVVDANTFWEYTNSLFIALADNAFAIEITMFVTKISTIFKLCDMGQIIMDSSK